MFALLSTLPASWQVMQDRMMHECREARGACWKRCCTMQGIPLALSLCCCLLLQFRQSPPLLLNHLVSCRRDGGSHRGLLTHQRREHWSITDRERGGEQEEANTAAPAPDHGPTNCAVVEASVCGLTSGLFLHPEHTQGTRTALAMPRQHASQLSPLSAEACTDEQDTCTHHVFRGRRRGAGENP